MRGPTGNESRRAFNNRDSPRSEPRDKDLRGGVKGGIERLVSSVLSGTIKGGVGFSELLGGDISDKRVSESSRLDVLRLARRAWDEEGLNEAVKGLWMRLSGRCAGLVDRRLGRRKRWKRTLVSSR